MGVVEVVFKIFVRIALPAGMPEIQALLVSLVCIVYYCPLHALFLCMRTLSLLELTSCDRPSAFSCENHLKSFSCSAVQKIIFFENNISTFSLQRYS